LPANKRLQLIAFGARDRGFFEVTRRGAPRRQLKRSTLGGATTEHAARLARQWYNAE